LNNTEIERKIFEEYIRKIPMIRRIVPFVSIVLLSFSVEAWVQPEGKPKDRKHFGKEEFDAKFDTFIVAELGLSPEEEAAFLPLCDEYRQKKFEAGRDCRRSLRELRKEDSSEDSRYSQVIDCCVEADLKVAQLSKVYYERFKKILPPAKLFRYREAEQKFIRRFLRRRERRLE
jgi:Spy/CpxP family protein refolding chaperone